MNFASTQSLNHLLPGGLLKSWFELKRICCWNPYKMSVYKSFMSLFAIGREL